jgi:hypothetical protein
VMALSRSWVLLVNRAGRSQPACLYFNALGHSLRKRGKFPGERRWIYAGAGRMRLARGGIFGPGMPRRAPMNS